MSKKIFVNLPVKDLKRSMDFFTALGLSFDPEFTDDKGACMVISDDGYVMLLTEPFFKTFTPKKVADASAGTEAIVTLGLDSREEVDELADKALAVGGSPANEPDDQGFMYGRSFQDPDGHLWEVFHMDLAAMREQAAAQGQR
ncbi:MAG TPA: VOC family protein [Streptomyces sp.]|uniref:VOC family protein n=1 Tax=Streptomyces sp. TaxID=1931 RepID=UPI002D455FB6|nr:VOC family protein [Streptomyces sp.]HZG05924.1 VOC family protein [Streptomyces sp.]